MLYPAVMSTETCDETLGHSCSPAGVNIRHASDLLAHQAGGFTGGLTQGTYGPAVTQMDDSGPKLAGAARAGTRVKDKAATSGITNMQRAMLFSVMRCTA